MDIVTVGNEHKDSAGAVVFWTIHGSVDYETLELAWSRAGCPKRLLPDPIEHRTALRRALQVYGNGAAYSKTTVRPIKDNDAGFVLIHEDYTDGTGRPKYTRGVEATLDAQGELLTRVPYGGEATITHAPIEDVARLYGEQLNTLSAVDVSVWLVSLARSVHALRLRDTGGVYFIPAPNMATWRMFTDALRGTGAVTPYEIPAMKTVEAVAAVLSTLTREVTDAATEITHALDEAIKENGEVSGRMRRAKIRYAESVHEKIRTYEPVLGELVKDLRESFEVVQARLAMATLQDDEAAQ